MNERVNPSKRRRSVDSFNRVELHKQKQGWFRIFRDEGVDDRKARKLSKAYVYGPLVGIIVLMAHEIGVNL